MERVQDEHQLAVCLRELPDFIQRGFSVAAEAPGLVVIYRYGGVRGIWLLMESRLAYVPGGYNEATHFVQNVDEAVAVTRILFDVQ